MDLSNKKCVPCGVGGKPLSFSDVEIFIAGLSGWKIIDNKKKEKSWTFKDFKEAMNFVGKVADIAESEGHHPDIRVHYNKVKLEIWTYEVGGLSENDFILASKIEKLG